MAPNYPHPDSGAITDALNRAESAAVASFFANNDMSARAAHMQRVWRVLRQVEGAQQEALRALALHEAAHAELDQALAQCKTALIAVEDLCNHRRG